MKKETQSKLRPLRDIVVDEVYFIADVLHAGMHKNGAVVDTATRPLALDDFHSDLSYCLLAETSVQLLLGISTLGLPKSRSLALQRRKASTDQESW